MSDRGYSSCPSTMAEISDTHAYERLAQLVKQTFEGDDQISSPKAKIQRIPALLLKNPNFAEYCSPQMISFGPIHHRNEGLKLGQRFKIQWTFLYIEEYSKPTHKSASEAAQFLHATVKDKLGELKKLFTKDVIESYNDEELAWMLFVDGCSLLYYMDNVDIQHPGALTLKIDQLMHIWIDILLLENQVPMKLLELLSKNKGADLDSLMFNFLNVGKAKRAVGINLNDKPKPTHILEYYRSVCIDGYERNQMIPSHEDQDILRFRQRYKNIRDLQTTGIRVKVKIDKSQWHDIAFTSGWFGGELTLPRLRLGSSAPHLYRNLIAYEMCPDFRNNFECCSFFSFMDSLIDDVEDVKELRLAGVIQNLLGSDHEVAKLFNELGNDLPTQLFNYIETDAVAYSKKYIEVKLQIHDHYEKTWNKWLAEAHSTYFKTPWSLIGFLAALLALVLTFIQTWYAIHPK